MEKNLEEQKNILEKKVEIILPDDAVMQKLELSEKEGRPLVIKLGFDPTAPDLHLGHALVLRKLKEFQELGHKIVFIIGDFTASIGDPTGKNKTRPPLSKNEIKSNAKTYVKQVSKVLDTRKIKTVYNSKWFKKMDLSDTIELLAKYNLGKMLTRDDFNNRYKNGTPIAMHEMVYPLLQGYDSIAIEADIEIGGTDQLFNLQVGRHLQEVEGETAQAIMCLPILRGIDGVNKMSKSLKNYIGITDEPNDMFGKVMSIPDNVVNEYINLATTFDEETKNFLKKEFAAGNNPVEIKKKIAKNIVEQFHSEELAEKASEFFYNQFQDKEKKNTEYIKVSVSDLKIEGDLDLVSVIVALKIRDSKNAARKLIEQGGVSVGEEKVTDTRYVLPDFDSELPLKFGKMNFYKLVK